MVVELDEDDDTKEDTDGVRTALVMPRGRFLAEYADRSEVEESPLGSPPTTTVKDAADTDTFPGDEVTSGSPTMSSNDSNEAGISS